MKNMFYMVEQCDKRAICQKVTSHYLVKEEKRFIESKTSSTQKVTEADVFLLKWLQLPRFSLSADTFFTCQTAALHTKAGLYSRYFKQLKK